MGKALDDAANQAAAAFSFLSRWASDEPVADILSGEPAPPPRAPSSPPPPRAVLPAIDCHVCGVPHLDDCHPRDVAAHARARAHDEARTVVVEAERVDAACSFCGGGGTVPVQGADRRWHLVACPDCGKKPSP